MKQGITAHILDLGRGCAAAGVPVLLEQSSASGAWEEVSRDRSDRDGRVGNLLEGKRPPGAHRYRMTFQTGIYYREHGETVFHPFVQVVFETSGEPHYHIPLLLNRFGYTTYRGT